MTFEHRLAFSPFKFDPMTGDLVGPSGLVPLNPKALALLGFTAGLTDVPASFRKDRERHF